MLYSIGSHFYCSFLNNNAYELRYGKSENCCTTKMNPIHLHNLMKELKDKKKDNKKKKKNVEKNVPPQNVDNSDVCAVAQTLSMAEHESTTWPYDLPDSKPEGVWTSGGVRRYYTSEVKPEWSLEMTFPVREDDFDEQPFYYMSAAKAQGMAYIMHPDTSDEPRIVEEVD